MELVEINNGDQPVIYHVVNLTFILSERKGSEVVNSVRVKQ